MDKSDGQWISVNGRLADDALPPQIMVLAELLLLVADRYVACHLGQFDCTMYSEVLSWEYLSTTRCIYLGSRSILTEEEGKAE